MHGACPNRESAVCPVDRRALSQVCGEYGEPRVTADELTFHQETLSYQDVNGAQSAGVGW